MDILLFIAIIVCVAIATYELVKSRRRRPARKSQYEIVDTCGRCGATRTSIVENEGLLDNVELPDSLLRGRVVQRRYTFRDELLGVVCRGTGHQWGERKTVRVR